MAKLLVVNFAICLGIGTSDWTRYTTCVKKLFVPNKIFETAGPLPTAMVPEEQERLLNWIRTRTGPKARILIEDSLHPRHLFWRSHLPAILPFLTQREYIGGPIPEAEIKHAFVHFYDGILFRKEISKMGPSLLNKYFNLYNIGWIICHTSESKKAFEKFAARDLQKELTVGPFVCYRLNREGSFFLKGKGRLQAGFNRFKLSEVEPEDGEIILKYHWTENLKTIPPSKMECFFYLDDPVGFIRILNPPKEFEIRFRP